MDDPATIVIVDDATDVRLLLKTRLRLSGALRVVGEGADGTEAVTLAQEHQPALMLLDVSMPGMDGLEALPKVLAASPHTKVALFSGFEEQGLVEKAGELGAARFIEKSEPIESLVQTLLGLLDADESDQADQIDQAAQTDHTDQADQIQQTSRSEHAPTATPTEELANPAGEVGTESPSGKPDADTPGATSDKAGVDQSVLDEHLERFREVFEEAAIGMATMTLSGRLVRVNRALAHLVKVPAAVLVGSFYGELIETREDILTGALDDIRTKSPDVVQLEHGVRATGGARWVRATLAPVRDSSGRPLYLFLQVQDVTAERAAAEELRRSEERFRLLVEAVEDYAIFMLDPTGHIASWNAGAQRSKGYTADEIIGKHFSVFYPPEVAATGHTEYELAIALRDGHYEEEGWRIRKDGSRFWANVLITAVYDDDGRHVGFAKVTRDTSERRRLEEERERAVQALATANAELESLNQRLQQAAQDQAQFLAVTAHELRTPIGVLAGSAQTLSRHWKALDDADRTELLEAMNGSAVRLRRLLADLLTASRLEASALDMHREPVPVAEVVADAVATVRRTVSGAEVVIDIPGDLTVPADRDRLTQALDNLLGNALRHGVPPVRVTGRLRPADHGSVEVRISDNGPGVDAAMQPRLFSRFATGRSRGGTGLGLYIVRELCRAHGGDAVYEPPSPERPEEPAGAFVVTLPRYQPG